MSTNENGASDGASEGESRRSPLIRPSAFTPAQPFASAHDVNAQRLHLQPHRGPAGSSLGVPAGSSLGVPAAPSLSISPTPSLHPEGASSQEAGSSPDSAMIYQMLQLMQKQMAQQQQMMSQLMQLHPLPQTSQPQQHSQQQSFVPQQQSFVPQQQSFVPQQQSFVPQQQSFVPQQQPELTMDALASSISEFRYEAESDVTFSAWFSRYDDLFKQDASRLDDAAKVRLLVRKLGTTEHSRYTSFILPRVPRDVSFQDTVSILSSLFGRAESLVSKRYKCMKLTKAQSEDILTFICRVNRSCVDYQFSSMSENQFKCLTLVCGLKDEADSDIRTRLLARIEERSDVTLEDLAAECQRIKSLKVDSAMIGTESRERVLAVHGAGMQSNQRYHRSGTQPANFRKQKSSDSGASAKPSKPCWLCGELHWSRDCKFKSHKCSNCGKIGHREGFCRTSGPIRRQRNFRKHRQVTSRVVTVNICRVNDRRKYVNLTICGQHVSLQLDTGSDITVISRSLWQQLGKPSLVPAEVNARTASGEELQLDGEFETSIEMAGKTREAIIRVTRANILLLGADLIDQFGLSSLPMDSYCKMVSSSGYIKGLQAKFPTVFSGTGLCTKSRIHLQLKEDARPVFCPKRPVAYAMIETVNKELDRLEQLNIITRVDFSEWAAPIVVVRKANGNIRICGDYSTGLNDALQPLEYPLPLPEDIFSKLAHSSWFSKVDLSDAFLQVEIHEQYRPLLTINTHRGLYHYNRLPPGIKVAPAAFQQIIDRMLAGLQGTSGYMDDVVVGGKTEEEHDENLTKLFQRLKQFGFSVRADKCSLKMKQIDYLGHVIDRHGIRPNPAKIEAIKNLPAPTDIKGVRSFLGAVNFYGKFVPKMRELRYPLDNLLKSDTKFAWNMQCEKAFKYFKEILSSDLLLTHYDPTAEIIVAADASSVGLGATISHKFGDGSIKVVQHASRALTTTEEKYSQIDREGLAIVFAVTKFHKMLYGRSFRLQTDHRPLLRIFGSKKGIPVFTANRLQRFALTLQLYDFSIEYVPTGNFGNADILSRLIRNHAKPETEYVIASLQLEEDVRSVVLNMINTFPLNFRDIEEGTRTDSLLWKVHKYIQEGWPSDSSYGMELARFYNRKDDLSTVGDCVLFRERVVIPRKLRMRCLNQLHRGHPGIQRMKSVARSYLYWPSIDEDIADCVSSCTACMAVAKSPPLLEPKFWPKTTKPWERVHIDYAGPVDGAYFLIVVDAFSKWPEVMKTITTTTTATISMLRSIFARFGMPEKLVSDNGAQFTSDAFKDYCKQSGIEHIKTPPFHPQSNGQAERFVDTMKRALKKNPIR
ncbi:uncharacterized protein K02A2.6-like [Anopheles arabiensis]|uniref:uncharacterized protein K02A2.6-like n=1 Tax=Anopheles arabiensis TaxID=7173 RepID=UPI001AAC6257|nr:uncharacterized protein K02A2.6-like [Anopheles arabiensis]